MQFTIIQDFLRSMNNSFRVGLRVGYSHMNSLYCSWPLAVLELLDDNLVMRGPFVGRNVVPKGSILDISLHCSFLSKFVRIKFSRNGMNLVADVYSLGFSKMASAIICWHRLGKEGVLSGVKDQFIV